MFWKRYGFAITWALPLGIALGAGIAMGVYLMGNPDFREQGGWQDFPFMLLMGVLVGAALALAAMIGATLLILIGDRNRERKHELEVWVSGGTMGAVAGVAVLWLGFAATNQLTPTASFANILLYTIIAAMTAGMAGYAASRLLRAGQARALREARLRGETTAPTDSGR